MSLITKMVTACSLCYPPNFDKVISLAVFHLRVTRPKTSTVNNDSGAYLTENNNLVGFELLRLLIDYVKVGLVNIEF